MRCFTFQFDPNKPSEESLTPGIKTILSRKGHRIVLLGAQEAHCSSQVIFFDRGKENEPVVDKNGLVHLAYPAKRTYNYKRRDGEVEGREKTVLKFAFRSPTKILLRINTSTPSPKKISFSIDSHHPQSNKINGRWQAVGGWPKEWAKAHGFSDGQRWSDDLIVMDDQDIIMIIPAGGGRSDRMIVRNDKGGITCLPEREYSQIVEAYKKEVANAIKARELAEEAEEPVGESVEADVDRTLEIEKAHEPEETKAELAVDSEAEGKAPRVNNTVIHSAEGETIGA